VVGLEWYLCCRIQPATRITLLQFYVILMMGAMDALNMYSNLAENKYLHIVASHWISSNKHQYCL